MKKVKVRENKIILDEMTVAFIKKVTIQKVLEQNYKMLDKLGVSYRRVEY